MSRLMLIALGLAALALAACEDDGWRELIRDDLAARCAHDKNDVSI